LPDKILVPNTIPSSAIGKLRFLLGTSIQFWGEHLAYKGNYMDLDPMYKDHLGDPLLRLMLDWRDNERRMAEFAIPKAAEIARTMGAKRGYFVSGPAKI
jgi:choline dehydrogenase-like flavoprotein